VGGGSKETVKNWVRTPAIYSQQQPRGEEINDFPGCSNQQRRKIPPGRVYSTPEGRIKGMGEKGKTENICKAMLSTSCEIN